jgi:hypothetical protein
MAVTWLASASASAAAVAVALVMPSAPFQLPPLNPS